MRAAYRYLGFGVALMVLFQAAVLAFGVFDLGKHVEDTGSIDKDTAENITGLGLHGIGAIILSVLVLALLVVSFFVKAEGAVKWAGIVFGLTLLQWVLAILAFSVPAIGLLHGVNAFAVAAAASLAARRISPVDTPATIEPAPAV